MRRNAFPHRRAFTVVELLVVIAVITLMIALLVGSSYRFVVSARESATGATILKASGIIQDRVKLFREYDFSDAAYGYLSAGYVNDVVLAEVIVRKNRFKKAFPQCFEDLDVAQQQRLFSVTVPPVSSDYDPRYESGIVLYALLMKGQTFGAPTPGEDTFTGAEVKNSVETGGLPCLVDAWGEPLRFYRWPTRLIRCGEQDFDGDGTFDDYNQNGTQEAGGWGSPAIRPYSSSASPVLAGLSAATPASLLIGNLPAFERNNRQYAQGADRAPGVFGVDDDLLHGVDDIGELGWPDSDDPEPLNIDPDDPTFRLSSYVGTAVTVTQFARALHDVYTFHTPLIVSAGPDRRLGLYEPRVDFATFGHLAAPDFSSSGGVSATMNALFDNITNLNQRAGGK